MPKGNHYPADVTPADAQGAATALAKVGTAIQFIPNLADDVLTTASISPQRLPLADLCIQAAQQAPDLMRKSFDLATLVAKLAAYRALVALLNQIEPIYKRIRNAVNVLGADVRFMVDNVHEDIETDNGETMDLGQLRKDIHAYYKRGGGDGGAAKPPKT